MAAVRQVGTEKRKLTKDMAQQIEKEVAETKRLVSERNKRNHEPENDDTPKNDEKDKTS
jgi:hypothetical protein